MKTYRVNVLPVAREDVADVYYYIALDSPEAALRVTDKIMDTVDSLSEFPERCQIVPDNELAKQGYRMLIIDAYIAFYKVIESEVWVYRILHGKRDYPQLLE